MRYLGLEFEVRNMPELEPGFVPMSAFFRAHQALAKQPYAIAVHRQDGLCSVYDTAVIGLPEYAEADLYYLDRLLKFLLWAKGGHRVSLCGDTALGTRLKAAYAPGGARGFDADFMARIYDLPFSFELLDYAQKPAANEAAKPVGRHLDGCRIGFDAGGSDRKVSAVIDGEAVYSEEVVWFPKENADPAYHYAGIVEAMKTAASKMPRVDAIGVSSAGVYIDNHCRAASLFIKVNEADFKAQVEDIYLRAAAEIGNVPVEVANDGDVTALAGAMSMDAVGVMGIAIGTSEAAGYVNLQGNITGWLNELAFAPVDANPAAATDDWSGDIGCGVSFFSQDGVIRLAAAAGIELHGASPAEKLKEVQALMAQDDPRAAAIYRSIGVALGHALGLYAGFYDIEHVLLMGRVTSGKGGDILLAEAGRVLKEEYPGCPFVPKAPDEKARRVGQSVAAASLPELK
ncbi:ROK family protein [Ruminococcaceae bacterium OttesenSCG-928-D13]|nr:ROK family protein [Ruminococcaceae bacterium OttesenSCG-928-D13]